MRKVLVMFLVVFGIFGFISCSSEEAVFKVGSDIASYEPDELSGYEVDREVYLQIMGPNDDEIFNGTVTVKSSNPTVYEAFLGAVLSKGIAQTSSAESGWIQAIDSYENGTNDRYWLAYNNGESILVGANSSQIRNGDYIQLKFEESSF